MFKTATVSFRTKQELLELLDEVSRESGCSRSSLIEMILRKYLADNGPSGIQFDKLADIKAGASDVDVDELSDGSVYLSLGKLKIGLSKAIGYKISFDENKSAFQLDLLPSGEKSSGFTALQEAAGMESL
ncbi:MAG: hypothetical protein ACLPN1_12395 [Dissulfurispiraceae bacterium]|jgi:hypothetical protein